MFHYCSIYTVKLEERILEATQERLAVERERLAVERQRLNIEEQRLTMDLSRESNFILSQLPNG